MDIRDLIFERAAQQELVKERRASLDDAKRRLDEIDVRLLEWLSDMGAKQFVVEDGPSIGYSTKPRAKCPAEYRQQWIEWLKDHGYDGLVKESIHHSTETAVVSELLEQGMALPDYVSIYYQDILSFRSNGYSVSKKQGD